MPSDRFQLRTRLTVGGGPVSDQARVDELLARIVARAEFSVRPNPNRHEEDVVEPEAGEPDVERSDPRPPAFVDERVSCAGGR